MDGSRRIALVRPPANFVRSERADVCACVLHLVQLHLVQVHLVR
jgi:hypothetical protein